MILFVCIHKFKGVSTPDCYQHPMLIRVGQYSGTGGSVQIGLGGSVVPDFTILTRQLSKKRSWKYSMQWFNALGCLALISCQCSFFIAIMF